MAYTDLQKLNFEEKTLWFVSDFRDVPLNDGFDLLERDFKKAQAARSQVRK